MKTIGNFAQAFHDRILEMDKELTAHGFDPEDFIIEKMMSYTTRYGIPSYIVTVQDQTFTVTMPNDIEFLGYFYNLCFPPEQESQDAQFFPKEHKLTALLQRLEKWLTAEPSEPDDNQSV